MNLRNAITAPGEPLAQRFALALVAFLAVMGGCFFYLGPQLEQIEQNIRATRDATLSINLQMQQIVAQEARNAADRSIYETLEKDGFLGGQNRLGAAKTFEALRIKHRISALEYEMKPVEKTVLTRPQESVGITLAETKITLSMRGFIDRDMHDFIEAVIRTLPGHVSFDEMEITRLQSPNNALLASISRGGGAELLSGEIELYWRVVNPADAAVP